MLNEVLYERQNLLKDLYIPQTASVVGIGGTGFWTAFFLAMSGVKELILVDADILEESNLNRLPFIFGDIRRPKVSVAKDFISQLRYLRIETHEKKIETGADCQILRGSIFCCTDNITSQQLICAYARKNNLPYQRIGYDGTFLNVSTGFPLTFETVDTPGYTITPSWVIPAAFAAAAGVSAQMYKPICLMGDLGDIHIQHLSAIPGKMRQAIRNEILDNITDHIPDDYGCCNDCSRGDCDDCSRGDCDNCNRRDCEDCDHLSPNDVKEKTDEAFSDGRNEGLQDKENGIITLLEENGIDFRTALGEAIKEYILLSIADCKKNDDFGKAIQTKCREWREKANADKSEELKLA